METSKYDPELHEPARMIEVHDLRTEIGELHERIEGLLEALAIVAHNHYRPLALPDAKVTAALHRARRTKAIAVVRMRD
jgi:hypothetical protein